jgi:hypothetical protein
VTALFHSRIRSVPTRKSYSVTAPWQSLLYILYVASVLIMIRSIYRVAEYVGGSDSVLQTSEFFLYILDGLPMIFVALIFNWFHPSRVVNRGKLRGDQSYILEEQAMPSTMYEPTRGDK